MTHHPFASILGVSSKHTSCMVVIAVWIQSRSKIAGDSGEALSQFVHCCLPQDHSPGLFKSIDQWSTLLGPMICVVLRNLGSNDIRVVYFNHPWWWLAHGGFIGEIFAAEKCNWSTSCYNSILNNAQVVQMSSDLPSWVYWLLSDRSYYKIQTPN